MTSQKTGTTKATATTKTTATLKQRQRQKQRQLQRLRRWWGDGIDSHPSQEDAKDGAPGDLWGVEGEVCERFRWMWVTV